jgi:hypothetical protein
MIMKIRWVVLIALLSLAVGVGGTSWYWDRYWQESFGALDQLGLFARAEADITTKVAVLERLRAGKIDKAIHLQEILLDGDLMLAGSLAQDGAKFNVNTRHALELEAKARAASGYEPDPRIRDAVQEAFRQVPKAVEDSRRSAQ